MLRIFGTDGIRCKVNQEPMTPDTCLKIAKAAGYLLSNKNVKKNRVIICKDTRLSGYLFEPLIASGFISMGMNVILVGPLPTPALAMLINTLRADIGVMITASHNTFEYNGIKFFDFNGNKISNKLEQEIENIVLNDKKYASISNKNFKTGKAKRLDDAAGRYSESLKKALEKNINFKNIKVVLDCANGSTYKVAPNTFWELGCDVVTIGNKPNGKNINQDCGAINTKNLSEKVLETKSDIGFAFDGDGDRLIIVDEKGKEIDGDKIIALLAKELLITKKLSKKVIVTTHMSNQGFENFLKNKLNIKLIRADVGDRNVIDKMQYYNCNLGGEQSGHIILSDLIKTGDGILIALKILEIFKKYNKKTSKLFDLFIPFYQSKTNIILKKDKLKKISLNRIYDLINKNKLKNKHLRYLVRPSGTEPLIRLLIEGKNKPEINKESKSIVMKINRILNDE